MAQVVRLAGLRLSLEALHRRLLAGDSDAADEVARAVLPLVARRLSGRLPTVERAIIEEAVERRLLEYFDVPETYDPARAPLDRFIELGAHDDVIDVLRRVRRRLRWEVPVGNELPTRAVETTTARSRWQQVRAVLRAGKTPQERAFLHARLRGERRTQVLAAILGSEHRTVADQRAEVHMVWVRLRTRIRRAVARRGSTRRLKN